jgi:hypothetical protein
VEVPDELALVHQPTRLQIVGLLYRQGDAAFTRVHDELDLTDGNLHCRACFA